MHLTDMPKLKILDVHLQETAKLYMRRQHETDDMIDYMERSKLTIDGRGPESVI